MLRVGPGECAEIGRRVGHLHAVTTHKSAMITGEKDRGTIDPGLPSAVCFFLCLGCPRPRWTSLLSARGTIGVKIVVSYKKKRPDSCICFTLRQRISFSHSHV